MLTAQRPGLTLNYLLCGGHVRKKAVENILDLKDFSDRGLVGRLCSHPSIQLQLNVLFCFL